MRRTVLCAVLVFLAVVLQYTLVDRLVPPGAGAPDLVLVQVAGLALWLGPAGGSVAGFAAGLAMDLAPPASHPVGELALIFCLVGYGCGRLAGWRGKSAGRVIVVAGMGAVTGETLQAAFGLAMADPQVTPAAVGRVLPAALLYDLVMVLIAAAGVAVLSRRRQRLPGPVRLPPPRRSDLRRPSRPARPVRLAARQMRAAGARSAGVLR
jgi:rod shape-determining protein MreD